MIYPGTDLKFRVTSYIAGFDMTRDEFVISVIDQHGRTRYSATKDECFQDEGGGWLFTVENVKTGIYAVKFTGYIPDDDYDKLTRRFVDMQPLFTVGYCDRHAPKRCCCDSHHVRYEQVWLANLDDGTYLCDADGNLVITEDGCRIKVKDS